MISEIPIFLFNLCVILCSVVSFVMTFAAILVIFDTQDIIIKLFPIASSLCWLVIGFSFLLLFIINLSPK